jgi:hypothetical protein
MSPRKRAILNDQPNVRLKRMGTALSSKIVRCAREIVNKPGLRVIASRGFAGTSLNSASNRANARHLENTMRKHHPDPYEHMPVSKDVLMRLG